MTKIQTSNIVYLGPEGSYTEIAAEYFMKSKNISDYSRTLKSSIIQVIEAVDNNSGNIGIVPIENSIDGIVRETVDNLVKTTSRVMITAEILVPISHCLVSKSNNIANIDKIISKPEAIAQCRHYIESNLKKDTEKIAAQSTSEAIKQLVDLPENYAAIGTAKAAQLYGLKVIANNINDEKDNLTRFVTLGSKTPEKTGNDKTSIAFSTCNKPGTLVDILFLFKENGLNLSYIESRPAKKVFGDYTFFIDFEGHIEDEIVQQTIGKMAPLVNYYRFLGSYPRVIFKNQ